MTNTSSSDTKNVPEHQPQIRDWIQQQLSTYTQFDALRQRRSRRFGWGMSIDSEPLAYQSKKPPLPLTEDEEAALTFAGVGITGYALADLSFGPGQGGSMLGGLVGRTVSSPDALNAVTLFVINDDGTYLIKRPQALTPDEVRQFVEASESPDAHNKLTDIYRKMRVKVRDGRTTVPVEPGLNFNINKWALYAKGGTYFLPVNDISVLLINVLIEMFSPEMGLYVIDERNFFQPAGIGKFAKSRGGHLNDDINGNTIVTIQGLEMSLVEAAGVEMGMVLQNLSLMGQTLGLGGFANYARSEFAWFEALNFQRTQMSRFRYGGAPGWLSSILKPFIKASDVGFPVGFEKDGQKLLAAYCPPNYPTMSDAVKAWVDHKYGPRGIYREGAVYSDWSYPDAIRKAVKSPAPEAVEAAIAYCEYIYRRYGRFPAYSAPFRTAIGYQTTRVDVDFYDKMYHPDALSVTQRQYPLNSNDR